jgi:hypothetical protein
MDLSSASHKCINENNDIVNKQDIAEKLFQEQDPCILLCVSHKDLCTDIQGGLMSCSDCGKSFLHLILSTTIFKSGKIISFQENDHNIVHQI